MMLTTATILNSGIHLVTWYDFVHRVIIYQCAKFCSPISFELLSKNCVSRPCLTMTSQLRWTPPSWNLSFCNFWQKKSNLWILEIWLEVSNTVLAQLLRNWDVPKKINMPTDRNFGLRDPMDFFAYFNSVCLRLSPCKNWDLGH